MGILIDFAVSWSYWTLFFKTEKLSSGIRCHCFYEFILRIKLSHNPVSIAFLQFFTLSASSKSQNRLIFKLPGIFSV